jgi:hypothetical protein
MRRPPVLLLLALIILMSVSVRAQQEPRRPGMFPIYGPVHTIRDSRATVTKENGTVVEGPRALLMTLTYNEDGTRQESTLYQPTGEIIHRRVEVYELDGRITERTIFRATDQLEGRTVTRYDDQKQRTEVITYRADGSITNRTTFHRNGDKLQSESLGYDPNGVIISQTRATSDLKTHQAESLSNNPRGAIQTQTGFINNPDGSQEYRVERSNGDFQRKVTRGTKEAIERVIYNRDGTVRSTERLVREFDSHDNMIKTTRLSAKGDSKDFETVDIFYRSITYYQKN